MAPVPNLRMAARVWRRDLKVFSKLWRGTLLPQFIDPVLYLLAMGFGLGTYLAEINGIEYKQFIAPGLVASAVMWAATFETTWNVFFRMEEVRTYDAYLTTPVEVEDIVAADTAWAATRALIYGASFLVIVLAFGLIESPWALALPPFLFLGGACMGMIGMAFTSLTPKMDYYTYYYTLFITPLFLFSGIFYPLDRLPDWVSVVAWFTPLYHLVEISRSLILDPAFLTVAANALWLAAVTTLLFVVPARAMRRRLVG